jgi:hypothetical protein
MLADGCQDSCIILPLAASKLDFFQDHGFYHNRKLRSIL